MIQKNTVKFLTSNLSCKNRIYRNAVFLSFVWSYGNKTLNSLILKVLSTRGLTQMHLSMEFHWFYCILSITTVVLKTSRVMFNKHFFFRMLCEKKLNPISPAFKQFFLLIFKVLKLLTTKNLYCFLRIRFCVEWYWKWKKSDINIVWSTGPSPL